MNTSEVSDNIDDLLYRTYFIEKKIDILIDVAMKALSESMQQDLLVQLQKLEDEAYEQRMGEDL